jgi:hypothetical protein
MPRTITLTVPDWVAERLKEPEPLADGPLVSWCVWAVYVALEDQEPADA